SAYAALGEVRRAVEHYEQALSIMQAIGDKLAEGSILGNLGSVYAALGDVYRAGVLYEQRLEIARAIGDRQGEAIASWNWGELLAQQGEIAAIPLLLVCVEYESELGHPDARRHAAYVEELRQQLTSHQGQQPTQAAEDKWSTFLTHLLRLDKPPPRRITSGGS